jgi:hypothetical protein
MGAGAIALLRGPEHVRSLEGAHLTDIPPPSIRR